MKWRKTQSWRSVATKFVKSVYSVGFEKDWFDFSIAKAAWSRSSVKRTSKCRKRGPQRFCLDAWPCLLFVLACNTQNLWKTWNNSVYCDVEQQGARRSVTRLDGARGKEQIWRPHVRTWGLSEANVLYWWKYLWHCMEFLAPGDLFPPRYAPGRTAGGPAVIGNQSQSINRKTLW